MFDYGIKAAYQKDKLLYGASYMVNSKSVHVGLSYGF